jgi:hypothetical protein
MSPSSNPAPTDVRSISDVAALYSANEYSNTCPPDSV